MAIYMTARWKARPESAAVVERALREFVAAVKVNEPKTRLYTALQAKGDEASFLTYFIFEDESAREIHSATDWVKRFVDIIYPENLAPVEFTEYRLFASTED
jgi:quinol monooxygenase YgiN